MRKGPAMIALAAVAVPLLGGVTYAAASSVSTHPSPQVVIPHQKAPDDPANHDARDDKKVRTTPPRAARPGAEDPPNHGAADDHGTDVTTATTAAHPGADNPATHDAGDDGGSGSGRSGSGGSSSGSGSGSGGSGRHGGDG